MTPHVKPRVGGSETGSAAPWVLSLIVLLSAAWLSVALVLSLVVAHRRAVAAADLAALSAAAVLRQPAGEVCGTAARVAAANEARLVGCRIETRAAGPSVVVVVERAVALGGLARWLPRSTRTVTASARSG